MYFTILTIFLHRADIFVENIGKMDTMEKEGMTMKQIILFVLALILFLGIGLFGLQYGNKEKNMIQKEAQTAPEDSSPTPSPEAVFDPMGAVESTVVVQLTSPLDNSVVATPSITVRGKTLPSADVFVNDKETKADANGLFSVSLTLDEGENVILVVANDSEGNAGEAEATVTYTIPE